MANVAHLQLARLLARRRELAIRVALGATLGRLVRQFLAESLLLATTGAVAGLLLGGGCTSLLVALGPADLPRMSHAVLDANVFVFTLIVAGAICLLFGLLPLVQASKLGAQALGEGDKAPAGRSRRRGHGVLVIAEVALALMLLAVAGLLTRSFLSLQGVDTGFSGNDAIAMDVSLGSAASRRPPARFFEQLVDRVRALPHVRAAGVTKDLPLSGEGSRRNFSILDGDAALARRADLDAECRRVSAGYFDAMGITLRSGRGFTSTDTGDGPGTVIVNAVFARRFLPGQEPLGRQVLIQDGPARPRRIIGVVADVRHFGLGVAAVPEMYIPHHERPWPSMTLVVRVSGIDPGQIVPQVRRELAALDKGLPLANVRTIREYVAVATAAQRFSMRLAGAFAVLALLLTALGVYGVMAYAVAQRTHEIAIRKALGADRRAILGLVLGEGLRLVLVGLLIGLAGALAAGRTMAAATRPPTVGCIGSCGTIQPSAVITSSGRDDSRMAGQAFAADAAGSSSGSDCGWVASCGERAASCRGSAASCRGSAASCRDWAAASRARRARRHRGVHPAAFAIAPPKAVKGQIDWFSGPLEARREAGPSERGAPT